MECILDFQVYYFVRTRSIFSITVSSHTSELIWWLINYQKDWRMIKNINFPLILYEFSSENPTAMTIICFPRLSNFLTIIHKELIKLEWMHYQPDIYLSIEYPYGKISISYKKTKNIDPNVLKIQILSLNFQMIQNMIRLN